MVLVFSLTGVGQAYGNDPPTVTLKTPFDLTWFRTTAEYKTLLSMLNREDPSVPGVRLTVEELDRALRGSKIEQRYVEWVERYASPLSRKKQRQRIKSVMHILLSKARLAQGKRFAQEHQATLERVAKTFGVDVADLVSMMNAESRFGQVQGDFRVVAVFVANIAYLSAAEQSWFSAGEYGRQDALSRSKNLKRVAKRKRYAMQNLSTVLRYARSRDQDPLAITGSWAGAIGITQFMPASLKWAKDGDGDGKVNLGEVPDAVASTANYLVEHGYRPGNLTARKAAFFAYNPNREYVNAIVAYADRFAKAWASSP